MCFYGFILRRDIIGIYLGKLQWMVPVVELKAKPPEYIFRNCSLYCKRMIRISFHSIETQQPGGHEASSFFLSLLSYLSKYTYYLSFLYSSIVSRVTKSQSWGCWMVLYLYSIHTAYLILSFFRYNSIQYTLTPVISSLETKIPYL